MSLKSIREKHNLTLAQVSEELGCSKQAYWNYEKGIRKLPLDKAVKLAALYNTSLDRISTCSFSNHNVN